MTKTKIIEVEQQNGTANPPTTIVPEGGAEAYPPEDAATVPVAAPVWEGGDPGQGQEPPPVEPPPENDFVPSRDLPGGTPPKPEPAYRSHDKDADPIGKMR
jgi:hypothetical protein